MTSTQADKHPFLSKPYMTIIGLSIPVTISMIAEPITGLIDTAFVAQLGSESLAALGVGTSALSSTFWIFNFLGISTQTEVAKALGKSDEQRASQITSVALLFAIALGIVLAILGLFLAPTVSQLLGAEDAVLTGATTYIRVRLISVPALLITMTGFGALRGLQDMRTPLYVAVGVNVMNVILDAIMIFGWGVIPAWGIGGSALASALSQWFGAGWVMWRIHKDIGIIPHINLNDIRGLIRVGGDLFLRTGLLTIYLLYKTRVANQIGDNAGAAHQVIRTIFLFTAFGLDGIAITTQSLVGYFLGSNNIKIARHVAIVSMRLGFMFGLLLMLIQLASSNLIIQTMLPDDAIDLFWGAWLISIFVQPLSAIAFVTDGIHWGTGDYTYLRNAMFMSTLAGVICLALVDTSASQAFTFVWLSYPINIGIRAGLGVLRVIPGIGNSRLRPALID